MSSVILPADRVEQFTVTVAAGTAASAATVTDLTFDPADVQVVDILIPPGHNGVTGIRLLNANGQAIPQTDGAWLIGDGKTYSFPITDFLNNGNWKAQAYNTGKFDHSWYITFHVNTAAALTVTTPAAPVAAPILV